MTNKEELVIIPDTNRKGIIGREIFGKPSKFSNGEITWIRYISTEQYLKLKGKENV